VLPIDLRPTPRHSASRAERFPCRASKVHVEDQRQTMMPIVATEEDVSGEVCVIGDTTLRRRPQTYSRCDDEAEGRPPGHAGERVEEAVECDVEQHARERPGRTCNRRSGSGIGQLRPTRRHARLCALPGQTLQGNLNTCTPQSASNDLAVATVQASCIDATSKHRHGSSRGPKSPAHSCCWCHRISTARVFADLSTPEPSSCSLAQVELYDR
jgi:hypothetical protein